MAGHDTLGNGSSVYRVLSLFSGMCGMDIGFAEEIVVHSSSVAKEDVESNAPLRDFVRLKRLPFKVVFQNDILPSAKKIADLNNWAHNYHLVDIRRLLEQNFQFPNADVVIGGFPCQDFSHAGKRQGLASQRGTLYQTFVEVVRRVNPVMFVAENVYGLLTMKGEPIRQIISDFSVVGYNVKYQLIKCEEIGIPQTRHRVIIMGVRQDVPSLPQDWNIIPIPHIHARVRDYFNHLTEPDLTTDVAQRLYSKASRLTKGQGQKEINLDGYAPTIRAEHHGNIEFRRIVPESRKPLNHSDMTMSSEGLQLKERRLTIREVALLQTFPPDCVLTDDKRPSTSAYKPIGNAVPPLLGYIVAKKVLSILDTVQKQMTTTKQSAPIKPFLKWVGGKHDLLDDIVSMFPKDVYHYYEPFLGGASVLLAVLSSVRVHGRVIASDANERLIRVYQDVQQNVDELIHALNTLKNEYSSIPDINGNVRRPSTREEALTSKEAYYYWVRQNFNTNPTDISHEQQVKMSAQFIFLNKTGFRGLYREGKNGFNVPFGHYRNPSIFDETHLRSISQLIQRVEFKHHPFQHILQNIRSPPKKQPYPNFVYLDPPYVPITNQSFVDYTTAGFNEDLHRELFERCVCLCGRAWFVMSNADAPMVLSSFEGNEAIQHKRIVCRRRIHRNTPQATTTELVVWNYSLTNDV